MPERIFLGWDVREMQAWNVAQASIRRHATVHPIIERLARQHLERQGLYTRPTEERAGRLWDVISDAPMATGHAIARFLVPALCDYTGWALFADGDILVRQSIQDLFALADPTKAVQVVQHHYEPVLETKMDGQIQTRYARKNWSSVVLWHCGHPANQQLTVDLVNRLPGRDLHRFCWLPDDLIGALPATWNWLAGHSDPAIDPALVHFTEGIPCWPGYDQVPYAEEWFAVARTCGYRFQPAVPA